MSSTQFWVGMFVPALTKWINPHLKKFFKLAEFDAETKTKVGAKIYPFYFSFLYYLWMLVLLSSGIMVLILLMIYGSILFPDRNYAIPVFLGLINMIGAWFVFGALLDSFFWRISSKNFKDYVKFRMIGSGWGYEIEQQVIVLLKIGAIYYLLASPLILYLLTR